MVLVLLLRGAIYMLSSKVCLGAGCIQVFRFLEQLRSNDTYDYISEIAYSKSKVQVFVVVWGVGVCLFTGPNVSC